MKEYDTIEKAFAALESAEEDVRADMGEDAVEAGYADIVEAVAWDCTSEVRAELMRRTGVFR
jgi:hypothetical protein